LKERTCYGTFSFWKTKKTNLGQSTWTRPLVVKNRKFVDRLVSENKRGFVIRPKEGDGRGTEQV